MTNRPTGPGGWARLARRVLGRPDPAGTTAAASGATGSPTPASPVPTGAPEPRAVEAVLTGVTIQDGVAELAGRITVPAPGTAPDDLRARLRLRGTQQTVEAAVRLRGTRSDDAAHTLTFTVVVDPATVPAPGDWDLEIAQVRPSGAAVPPGPEPAEPEAVGFGAARTGRADTDGRVLGTADDILSFTAPGGNASLARGVRRPPVVTARRLQGDPDGRPEVVLAVPAVDDDLRVYADVTPAGSRDARSRLPWRRDGEGAVAARLPVPHRAGELEARLVVVADGVRTLPHLDGLGTLDDGHGVTVRAEDGALSVTRQGDRAQEPRTDPAQEMSS